MNNPDEVRTQLIRREGKDVAVKFDQESNSYVAVVLSSARGPKSHVRRQILATGEAMSVTTAVDVAVDNYNSNKGA